VIEKWRVEYNSWVSDVAAKRQLSGCIWTGAKRQCQFLSSAHTEFKRQVRG